MTIPRSFAIARNLARNINWVARGTIIGEPERPTYSEDNQTGMFYFSFADTHTGRLYRVTVEEIDIRGQPVNRSDGK